MSIRCCRQSDIDVLQQLGYETYDQTFRDLNTTETMNQYLQAAFNKEQLLEELSTQGSSFFFIHFDKHPAGYLKLNESPNQTDLNDPKSLEIERIYILKEYQGYGLGKALITKAFDIATKAGKEYTWLGVWEKNYRAIEFYLSHGFVVIGRHPFKMGDEIQTDLIMKKTLKY